MTRFKIAAGISPLPRCFRLYLGTPGVRLHLLSWPDGDGKLISQGEIFRWHGGFLHFVFRCVGGFTRHPETHASYSGPCSPGSSACSSVCRLLVAGMALRQGLREGLFAPGTALSWLTAGQSSPLALLGLARLRRASGARAYDSYPGIAVVFAIANGAADGSPLALAWNLGIAEEFLRCSGKRAPHVHRSLARSLSGSISCSIRVFLLDV